MTTDEVLARGEELRQQGVADGGGLWASAEYVDWLVEHGEALMRATRLLQEARADLASPLWSDPSTSWWLHVRHTMDRIDATLGALGESKPDPRVP